MFLSNSGQEREYAYFPKFQTTRLRSSKENCKFSGIVLTIGAESR